MEHLSVMRQEVLDFFKDRTILRFVDGTLGAGGHAEAILEQHPEIEEFIGLDQDQTALDIAAKRLAKYASKLTLIHTNFDAMSKVISKPVDGILLDIGVSSMQLDRAERGFSFMQAGPLDMRMNQNEGFSAEDIVNSWPETDLANLIFEFGEERRSRQVAKAICERRRKKRITTTDDLAEIIATVVNRQGKMHPATRTFQALRIAVNQELERLSKVIPEAVQLLNPAGRLVIISFHSLEDRIVKNSFRENSHIQILTKKPLEPTREEARRNPRARSAKVRAAERLAY